MFLLSFYLEIVISFCKIGEIFGEIVRLRGKLFLIFFVFVAILFKIKVVRSFLIWKM